MAETDWIKAAVTTLDEVALAIRDLDKAELTRLCSSCIRSAPCLQAIC